MNSRFRADGSTAEIPRLPALLSGLTPFILTRYGRLSAQYIVAISSSLYHTYDLTIMPSLTRKLIKGRPYYYLRHCQRIDGKPKIVKTVYLGSADQLVARFAAPPHAARAPMRRGGRLR